MAMITTDFLEGVLTQFRGFFIEEIGESPAPGASDMLAADMREQGERVSLNWWGTVGLMQNVTNDVVQFEDVNPFDLTLINNEFQNGFEVSWAAMRRDKLGLHRPKIQELAQEARRFWDQLVLEIFETNPVAFDAITLFNSTRVIGESSNIDNTITAAVLDSVAEFQAGLQVAQGAIMAFEDDKGRARGLRGNVIVCRVDEVELIWQALNVDQAGNQDRAVMPANESLIWQRAGYTVIANPHMTTKKFVLLHNGSRDTRKGFVRNTEVAPDLWSDTNPNTREAIIRRSSVYSAFEAGNVVPTDPRFFVENIDA